MACAPYPCGCECRCVLVCLIVTTEGTCKIQTSVNLVRRCPSGDTYLDLDAYSVKARVSGDGGILWEGDASDLPLEFTGEISDYFELYAWSEPGVEGFGVCDVIESDTETYTFNPSCKECPANPPCKCFEGDFISIPDAEVTVAGSSTVKPFTATHLCSPATPTCGDISGTYLVPCGTFWFAKYTFLCSSGSSYYYYINKIKVKNEGDGVIVELTSGIGLGVASIPTSLQSGSGTGPINGGSVQVQSIREAMTHLCSNVSISRLIYHCKLASQEDFIGTAPTENACDLTAMTVTISR